MVVVAVISLDQVLHFMALLRLNRMLQFYRVVLAFDYLEMDVYRRTINLRQDLLKFKILFKSIQIKQIVQ